MVNATMFSSKKHDWETPDELLTVIERYRPIRLDPCTTHENPTHAAEFFTPADDGLCQDWNASEGGLVYVNPPYGRQLSKWVGKAVSESLRRPMTSDRYGTEIIMLLPARPDTKNWQHGVFENANAICFIKGRVRFKGADNPAPFPSALVYFGDREDDFVRHFSDLGQTFTMESGAMRYY